RPRGDQPAEAHAEPGDVAAHRAPSRLCGRGHRVLHEPGEVHGGEIAGGVAVAPGVVAKDRDAGGGGRPRGQDLRAGEAGPLDAEAVALDQDRGPGPVTAGRVVDAIERPAAGVEEQGRFELEGAGGQWVGKGCGRGQRVLLSRGGGETRTTRGNKV